MANAAGEGMRMRSWAERAHRTRGPLLSLGLSVFGVGLLLGLWPAPAHGLSTRDALWHMVNGICQPMHAKLGVALPCLKVDSTRGFAVVRAPADETRILIVPTRRIIGVESRILEQDSLPAYWSFAWNERSRVAASAPRPLGWNDIAMVVNSRVSRTQDQLHIHVGCVDARLKRALALNAARLTAEWSPLDLKPWAARYLVKRVGADGVDGNIFRMVATEVPGAKTRMTRVGIGVVGINGAKGDGGFAVLMNERRGFAEQLLDHRCSERAASPW
ncbi:MAG: CDP-diacylglycerol diphosphatase [Methylacidiphilales bacterium]|nr:CDP-diacylglycerol diphosphatase [Candidatus Methylacidiphilales bacterium]